MTKAIPVPTSLRGAGRTLWRDIAKQWAEDGLIPDARERRLLADACREADIAAALDAEINTALSTGQMVVKGSQGQPVSHPLLSQARASRTAVRVTLGKLGMEDPAAEEEVGRGGRTTSTQARDAAFKRHQRGA
jgi:hypothetical protein